MSGGDAHDQLRRARAALEAGDARHAAHHLAAAMTLGPTPEVEGAVARLLGLGGPKVLELVPLGDGVYFGVVALRAALLMRTGRGAEGVSLMLQAQAAVPSEPLLPWVERWLDEPEVMAALDLNGLARLASFDAQSREQAQSLLSLVQRVQAAREPSGLLAMLAARIARGLGRLDQAMAIAQTAHQREPSWATAVAVAGVHRAKGELGEAVDWYRRAAQLGEPHVTRLDEGDLLLELTRFDEAVAAYESVPESEKQIEWARPSALFTRAFGLGDGQARELLLELAAGGSTRAQQLRNFLEPYVYALSPPEAAVLSMARSLDGEDQLTQLALSAIEPPSAIWAFRQALRRRGGAGELPILFSEIPPPEPRRGSTRHPLWTYRTEGIRGLFGGLGSQARPALPPPSGEVRARVAALAQKQYHIDAWSEEARQIAAPADELRAVMVHPPDAPEGATPWDWLFRVQVAAALALAWRGPALSELGPILDGPVDWTITAALIALTQRAREEPAGRSAAAERLDRLIVEPHGAIHYECTFMPAVRCRLRLDPPEPLRSQLLQIRRENDTPHA